MLGHAFSMKEVSEKDANKHNFKYTFICILNKCTSLHSRGGGEREVRSTREIKNKEKVWQKWDEQQRSKEWLKMKISFILHRRMRRERGWSGREIGGKENERLHRMCEMKIGREWKKKTHKSWNCGRQRKKHKGRIT